jgi:hypothetical protein
MLSLPIYDGFIDRCDEASREFAILKNGVIIRRPKEDHFERLLEIVAILSMLTRLLFLATTVYPEAVDDIAGLSRPLVR